MPRDCSVGEGLDYVATWNSAQLLSEDLYNVVNSLTKISMRTPTFSKM
jgi:hypothetical protein